MRLRLCYSRDIHVVNDPVQFTRRDSMIKRLVRVLGPFTFTPAFRWFRFKLIDKSWLLGFKLLPLVRIESPCFYYVHGDAQRKLSPRISLIEGGHYRALKDPLDERHMRCSGPTGVKDSMGNMLYKYEVELGFYYYNGNVFIMPGGTLISVHKPYYIQVNEEYLLLEERQPSVLTFMDRYLAELTTFAANYVSRSAFLSFSRQLM